MRATIMLLGALSLYGCTESDIDPMMRQEKFKPYWADDFYVDGRAMRVPSAGTVPRERDLAAATPPPVTAALLQRGRERFDIHCAVCHGYAGDGDSVVASKMSLRAPPTLVDDKLRAYTVQQIFLVATEGYGVVLNLAGFPPWENVNTLLGQQLDGAFTIWVRRPLVPAQDGSGVMEDYNQDDQLVITSEGTAPYRGAAAGANVAIQRRAVRVLEIQVSKIDPGDCESSRGGQAGAGALGSNFDPCQAVSNLGLPGAGGVPPGENLGVH